MRVFTSATWQKEFLTSVSFVFSAFKWSCIHINKPGACTNYLEHRLTDMFVKNGKTYDRDHIFLCNLAASKIDHHRRTAAPKKRRRPTAATDINYAVAEGAAAPHFARRTDLCHFTCRVCRCMCVSCVVCVCVGCTHVCVCVYGGGGGVCVCMCLCVSLTF